MLGKVVGDAMAALGEYREFLMAGASAFFQCSKAFRVALARLRPGTLLRPRRAMGSPGDSEDRRRKRSSHLSLSLPLISASGTEDAAVADLVDRVADERAAPPARADAAERLRDLLEDSAKVSVGG